MAEGGSNHTGSENNYDFFCEVCEDDTKHLEAFGFCIDCDEYLCEECYNAHKRPRSTRHHVLKDKNTMPKNTPMSTDRVNKTIGTKCKSHNAELVEFYCTSHAIFGCSTCFATLHKNCQKVESIQMEAKNIMNSQDYKKFLLKLKAMKDRAEDMIKLSSSNASSARKLCSEFEAAVRQIKDDLINVLNETESSIISMANLIRIEDEQEMNHIATTCNDASTRIDEIRSEIEDLQLSKRTCQLYIKMKERAGDIITLDDNIRSSQRKNAIRKYRLELNSNENRILRVQEALGKLSFVPQQTRSADITPHVVSSNLVSPNETYIYVRSGSDSATCHITGSAIVSNKRAVLADRKNYKVKLVDTHANILISELKLQSGPWAITVVSQNKVAVTLPDSGKILLLCVKDTIRQEREINVSVGCRGVAYSQDRLVVSYAFVDKPCLEIIDLRGNVIRKVADDIDGRKKLFTSPFNVCVSNDGKIIYVSDLNRHTVTGLSLQGIVKSVYKNEELRWPRGMCSDQNGNVYVCGYGSKNLHKITADCKSDVVIPAHADGPDCGVLSVSHCQVTNRLFIGMEGKNYVKVFLLL